MTEAVPGGLAAYLARQRWFAGKDRPFQLGAVGTVALPPTPEGPRVVIALVEVAYADGGAPETWQVPLSWRTAPVDRLEHALIGPHDGLFAYDAVHDRDAMAQLARAFDTDTGQPRFVRVSDQHLDLTAPAAVLDVDQSNSSVAFGEAALLKVFRKITPGINPDIEIHERLTRAGSHHVAALLGWVEHDTSDGVVQLGMLQQFLRTASDGWTLARGSMRSLLAEADLHPHEVGGDFATEAARLGEAVAATHATLAAAFPVDVLDKAASRALAARLVARLDAAVRVVPALAAHADVARPVLEAVGALAEIPVQRIHGDLHLGQTLRTVKGWKLVDFEGEPARPLAERREPASAWRDVAGMLRSLDYVSAVVEREVAAAPTSQADYRRAEWVERNREAFLAAYSPAGLTDAERVLCDAFELDKALYECAYEAGSRPDWVDIPLAAVARLVAN